MFGRFGRLGMQTYLYWIGGGAFCVFLYLIFAVRRAKSLVRVEKSRRKELEELVHRKIKDEGAREMLDLWDAYMSVAGRHRHRAYIGAEQWVMQSGQIWPQLRPGNESRAIEIKRKALSKSGPKSFYYLDETQVRDLYPQVFTKPEPKEIETQKVASAQKGAKAKLKLIEGELSDASKEQTTTRYEIELTPVTMYNRVEEYLIRRGDVIFGLEEFYQDEHAIEGFRAMCQLMEEKFHFPVPDDLQKKFISDQMRSSALNVVESLSDSSGYIVLQKEFVVSHSSNDSYILSLDHPLNQQTLDSDPKAHIDICCQGICLTQAGKATFAPDSSVKITCLGKVVRWDEKRGCLVVNPIAIY